jgi:putative copper export protein
VISAVLLGPTVYRLVTFDPVLEAVYGVLLLVWFGSLGRMWFLTFANLLEAKHD